MRRKRAKAGGHVGSQRSEFDPFFYKLLSWIIIWGFVAVAQPFPILFLSGSIFFVKILQFVPPGQFFANCWPRSTCWQILKMVSSGHLVVQIFSNSFLGNYFKKWKMMKIDFLQ